MDSLYSSDARSLGIANYDIDVVSQGISTINCIDVITRNIPVQAIIAHSSYKMSIWFDWLIKADIYCNERRRAWYGRARFEIPCVPSGSGVYKQRT